MENHMMKKTAIITGAGGGIGRALSVKLAGYGMNLVLTGRKEEPLRITEELARKNGAEILIVPGELTDLNFQIDLLSKASETFGGIDVLINNAGLAQNCTVEEITPELFDQIMKINVRAPYFLCQKALPYLRNSDCATIINICSVVAHKGYPFQSVYGTSKHALLGFSKSLANEVFKDNIRVHVISPGSIYTDMIALVRPDLSPEGMMMPEDIAEIAGFFLEHRHTNAVIDEIQAHRVTKEPFA